MVGQTDSKADSGHRRNRLEKRLRAYGSVEGYPLFFYWLATVCCRGTQCQNHLCLSAFALFFCAQNHKDKKRSRVRAPFGEC